MDLKKVKKTLVRQQDQADCGVACLLSVISYYGGESNFSRLRQLSGTTSSGCTLLGLSEAANSSGFDSDGVRANMDYITMKSNAHQRQTKFI